MAKFTRPRILASGFTNKDVSLSPPWAASFVLPKGSEVQLMEGVDGLLGNRWAVSSVKLLVALTGNAHDPHYRFVFVETGDVDQAS